MIRFALAGPGVGPGAAKRGKHEADFGFREGYNFRFFRARGFQFPKDVLTDKGFMDCPGP